MNEIEALREEAAAWRRACKFLYAAVKGSQGEKLGTPTACSRPAWQEATGMIGQAEEASSKTREALQTQDMLELIEQLPLTADGLRVVPYVSKVWHWEDITKLHPDIDHRFVHFRTSGGKHSARLRRTWDTVPFHYSEWVEAPPGECYGIRENAVKEQRRRYARAE